MTGAPEKPHKCRICDKSFRKTTDRNKHEETHNTERTYECEYCHKKYKTSKVLVVHKIHMHTSKFQI